MSDVCSHEGPPGCRESHSLPDSPVSGPTPGNPSCRYCGGSGEVVGVVDDVEFSFRCPCSGGCEEAVRWLLGPGNQPPQGDIWVI
jgi:hypothetical protein